MTDFPDQQTSADLAAARLVRRMIAQWPLIVACAVIAGLAGYLVSSRKHDQYAATTTIQLNDIDLASVFLAQSLQQQGVDAAMKAATAAKLARMPNVLQAAAADVGGISRGALAHAVTVSVGSDTTLINIRAVADSPNLAAREANAVRRAFVNSRRDAAAAQMITARQELQTQIAHLTKQERKSATGWNLANRLNQINTIIATAGAGVTTVQPATPPTGAFAPRPKRTALLAFLLGGLLGVGAAFLRARLDDHIRDVRELAEHWDLPVLGLIPQTSDLAKPGAALPSAAALEAFALTRTNMRYLQIGGDVRTLVVTSAMPGEGKSTVAWNLALAAAMAEQRVLLIDADLRRPVLAQRLGVRAPRGFSELLAGLAEPSEVIEPVAIPVTGAGSVVVDVIGAGFSPPSPIALLERPSTATTLAQLGEPYDLVVIDSPPATVVGDAKVLMSLADGAVVVSRLGRVTRSALDRLRDLLSGLETPVLGTVVNAGASAVEYGYASYGPSPSTADTPSAPSAPPSSDRSAEPAGTSA